MLGRTTELTRGPLLARNVVLNIGGWVVPAASALVAIPALVRAMGAERFGLLALAWTLVGSFSAFDLGIGRALTQVLSERVGVEDQADSPHLTWSALWVLAPLGVACGLLLAVGAPRVAGGWLHIPHTLHAEAIVAMRLLAAAVPLMVVTSGMRGVLEAGQRFRVINALRVPLGVLTFLGPWLVQPFSHALPASVAMLVAARALAFVLHAVVIARSYPELRRPRAPRRVDLVRLWRVAGWMTVSTIATPILVAGDRFLIGAVLPMAAVAYYTTASEAVSKLSLFTAALQPVLFPALAVTLVSDRARATLLFDRGIRATALLLAPMTLLVVAFAPEALRLWVGAEFAREGTPVLQWLTIAVFVNACAAMPYAVLQSAGRSDLPGKLHAFEVPAYLGTLWLLLHRFGLRGVAIAWLLRMLADALALIAATRRVLPDARAVLWRATAVCLLAVVAFGAVTLAESLPLRGALAALGLTLFGVGAHRWLVTPAERELGVRIVGLQWSALRRRRSGATAATAL